MEPITTTAIAVFLAPYLQKAGEKVAERTVETLFDSRQDIAERFKGLFKNELISLDLGNTISSDEIKQKLEANPQIMEEIHKLVLDHQDLLNKVAEALSKQEGRTINTKTYIENAKDFVINQ
jgi:hypothetical protein